MQNLNIVALQSHLHWEDKVQNFQHFDQQLEKLKTQPDIIILPEMFNTGFAVDALGLAEATESTTLNWMQKKAAEIQAVIVGSFIVKEDEKMYNRLVWMMPSGSYETYDKRHLFRMGGEHKLFSGGNKNLIINYKGWKIKPMICYDLRFPVWAKNQYRNQQFDYDMLIYIANWPQSRRNAWDTLLSARAIENLAYVVGVNRVGADGKGLEYSGGTAIYHPKGNVISKGEDYKESFVEATLIYDELQRFRESFNVGQDWDDFVIKR